MSMPSHDLNLGDEGFQALSAVSIQHNKRRRNLLYIANWPLSCVLTCLLPSFAHSMDPIDTDGPDFVESSEVVPEAHFQYEFDSSVASASKSGEQKKLSSTPLLLKYGIAQNLELRLASDGYMNQNGQSGTGNTAFGLKYHAQDRNTELGKASISWILHVQTPMGANNFKTTPLLPSLRSVLTWDLPNDLALGLMPGVGLQSGGDGQTFTAGIFGAVLNKRMSDKTRMFVELSIPTFSKPNQNGVVESFDIGGAYLLTHVTQIGFRAGVGLNSNTAKEYGLFEVDQRF